MLRRAGAMDFDLADGSDIISLDSDWQIPHREGQPMPLNWTCFAGLPFETRAWQGSMPLQNNGLWTRTLDLVNDGCKLFEPRSGSDYIVESNHTFQITSPMQCYMKDCMRKDLPPMACGLQSRVIGFACAHKGLPHSHRMAAKSQIQMKQNRRSSSRFLRFP